MAAQSVIWWSRQPEPRLNIKTVFPCTGSFLSNKTFVKLSYLYNGNTLLIRQPLYIITLPCLWLISLSLSIWKCIPSFIFRLLTMRQLLWFTLSSHHTYHNTRTTYSWACICWWCVYANQLVKHVLHVECVWCTDLSECGLLKSRKLYIRLLVVSFISVSIQISMIPSLRQWLCLSDKCTTLRIDQVDSNKHISERLSHTLS